MNLSGGDRGPLSRKPLQIGFIGGLGFHGGKKDFRDARKERGTKGLDLPEPIKWFFETGHGNWADPPKTPDRGGLRFPIKGRKKRVEGLDRLQSTPRKKMGGISVFERNARKEKRE